MRRYLTTYLCGDVDRAHSLVGDDFVFQAPLVETTATKEAFFAGVEHKLALIRDHRILRMWAGSCACGPTATRSPRCTRSTSRHQRVPRQCLCTSGTPSARADRLDRHDLRHPSALPRSSCTRRWRRHTAERSPGRTHVPLPSSRETHTARCRVGVLSGAVARQTPCIPPVVERCTRGCGYTEACLVATYKECQRWRSASGSCGTT